MPSRDPSVARSNLNHNDQRLVLRCLLHAKTIYGLYACMTQCKSEKVSDVVTTFHKVET
jgi:hypothetical protein